jgi:hypothetical protein
VNTNVHFQYVKLKPNEESFFLKNIELDEVARRDQQIKK